MKKHKNMLLHNTARGKIVINQARCKGCLLCIESCPKGLIAVSDEINVLGCHPVIFKDGGQCTGCGMCYQMCPDVCITVYKK